jgi:tetratricopeptide (TPR) repeat protein
MLKKRIYIASCILLLLLVVLVFAALKQSKELRRDPVVLMNKYYRFKQIDPEIAKKSLLIILKQDAHYLPALAEYSQWALNDHDLKQAQHSLEELHRLLPNNDTYTFQLGYLYYKKGNWEEAKGLFMGLLTHAPGHLKIETERAITGMASYLPNYQYQTKVETPGDSHVSLDSQNPLSKLIKRNKPSLLELFYFHKDKHKARAKQLLKKLLLQQPANEQALQEAGFIAIHEQHPAEAIHYFSRAHALTYHPHTAMQLAYLYDAMGDKPTAYKYFKLVSQSNDKLLALKAQNAMTNLAGLQTKALPPPYFSEVFFTPFTQSRFGLTVTPFIARLGVEQHNYFQTREYVFFRRTQDNRSANLGELSQIYEDNVQITGIGGQFIPFRKLPIVGFLEAGEAYDLIYMNRNRWRGDLRGGFMFYQECGAKPAYFDKITIGRGFYSTWYGDITYFSRYNNNVIGLGRTHQGIRLLQYKSSMVNLYVTGRILGDTNRDFFNNFAEIGPGISFIPTNRFNVQLRLEHVNGVYLPAGALVNPYGKYYTNNVIQLLFYVRV